MTQGADPPAVHLDGITKRFPGVVANDDVDLAVEKGSVHALLGENGAGKTTLMNVLYGLYHPTEGQVVIDGVAREFDSPRDAIDAGIGMIHQHFMLVEPMQVWENVVLGNEPTEWFGTRIDEAAAREAVEELSSRYGFDVDPDDRVADISVGVRQRVEILKALYCGADVLILDEPTAVLTPQEVEDLYGVFEELTAQGKTIIFITHKLGEAMHAADGVTVLRDGKNVGTVSTDDVTREELAELMVGREVLMERDTSTSDPGEAVLDVQDLTVEDDRGVEAVSDVSATVREGEVFGIAGVDGNGQSQLIEAITGLRDTAAGEMAFRGESLEGVSRSERIDRGMAYVPEDRHARGLVMPYDLVQNAILGSQHHEEFASGGRIDWDAAGEHAERLIEAYDVRPPSADATAESFSGGNQQKFIVGREFERDPELVVATHPTRGVDIGSTEFIHDRLMELRDEGKAVLLVSSKLDEVQSLSDRLAVMHEGTFSGVVDPATVTEEQLGLLMAGESLSDDTVERARLESDGTAEDDNGENSEVSA
ncbi:ABC transporter ATP-binding protein [Halorubrum gandharaense]